MVLSKDEIVERVRAVLKEYGSSIKFAYLFGSYAKEQADEYSDIDIGIYFDPSISDELRNQIRFKIYESLEPHEVDLCYLDLEDTSPEIILSAIEGVPVVINDEESQFEAYRRSVHLMEELRVLER